MKYICDLCKACTKYFVIYIFLVSIFFLTFCLCNFFLLQSRIKICEQVLVVEISMNEV